MAAFLIPIKLRQPYVSGCQFLNNMTPENAAHLGESYRLCTVTLLSKSANWDENSWLEDGLLPPRLLIRCWLVAHARTDLGSVRTFFSKLFITWLNADNYSYTECRTALSGT
ncbi:hypothetical protein FGIG_11094 [Fasciola gigantica]|uniref:Uncharacterized protein n=1 Tax=Fasciola gigantica TaxID=46835 RepID=A0A504YD17_FASGI|nr:hypothetical protein FGIG_11094 [Fasciola gigantica]